MFSFSMFSYRIIILFCEINRKYLHCTGKSVLLKTLYRSASLTIGTMDLRAKDKSVLYFSTGFL